MLFSTEESGIDSSGNESTEWESSDDDAKDEDYDPDAASDPTTEHDYGSAMFVLEGSEDEEDDFAA